MQKNFYRILDILLIIGAFVAVLTINGGKLIFPPDNANYTPVEVDWATTYILRNAYEEAQTTTTNGLPQTGAICQKIALPGIPEWDQAQLLLAAYEGDEILQNRPGSLINTCEQR